MMLDPLVWFTIGLAFFGLEILFDGFYLGSIGIGALLGGIALFAMPDANWGLPFTLWGIGTVAGCFALHRMYRNQDEPPDPNDF